MVDFCNTEIVGIEQAVRTTLEDKNRWNSSDSGFCIGRLNYRCDSCPYKPSEHFACGVAYFNSGKLYVIGPEDMKIIHRNLTDDFLCQIMVYTTITAPMYWWWALNTYDTHIFQKDIYNSDIICKDFTMNDFLDCDEPTEIAIAMSDIIKTLNDVRTLYFDSKDYSEYSKYFTQLVSLIPSSYKYRQSVILNYKLLSDVYRDMKHSLLKGWRKDFVSFVQTLPYSEFIM